MKFRFSLLLLLFINNSFSQNKNDFDSLKKYSYAILLVSKNVTNQFKTATCFFVNDSNQLYLISAGHNFNCVDVFKGEMLPKENQHDSVFMTYYDDSIKEFAPLRTSIESYRDNAYPYFMYDKPDILCWQLPPLRHFQVNAIEKTMIESSLINEMADDVLMFGYTGKTIDKPQPTIKDLIVSRYSGKQGSKIYQNLHLSNLNRYDSINIFIRPDCENGFSGSPLFLIHNNNILFGGVAIGMETTQHISWIVKPQIILEKINYLKTHPLGGRVYLSSQ